jgi:hypothetical protein
MLGLATSVLRMKRSATILKASVGAGILIGQGLESMRDKRREKAADRNREKQERGESLSTLDLIKEHGLLPVTAFKYGQYKASKEK